MHGLLLVEVPRETVYTIREGFPTAELEETRSDQAAIVLERAVEDLEAVVVGPACMSFVEIAECAASLDPALAVVILCLPEMSARVATATRFAPSLGKDVRSFVLTGNEPLGSALRAACAGTRQRRSHRELLAAIHEDSHATQSPDAAPRVLVDRLQETEERYRVVVETMSDGVITIDEQGVIMLANPACERIFGRGPGEILKRPLISLMPERLRPTHQAAFARYLETSVRNVSWEGVELTGLHKTGREIPLEISFGEHLREGHRQFTGILRDISERKLQEEALREAADELKRRNTELAHVNRELEEFTSIASHDMQSPLRKLVSFASLLREDAGTALPEAAERDLGFITQGARRMQGLVQDLLELSHAGQSALKPLRLAVDECVDRALEDLALELEQSKARVERASLPILTADTVLLTGIYRNLIGNAIKFSGDAAPSIRLTAEREGSHWILGVSDEGIGIPQGQTAEIFKPFRRLHPPDAYEGSGIGLAFCRKAVERHGGRIWVDSEPGRGSSFSFVLGE